MEKTRPGTRRIELSLSTGGGPVAPGVPFGDDTIVVVWKLQPNEGMIVARCLREVLQDAAPG